MAEFDGAEYLFCPKSGAFGPGRIGILLVVVVADDVDWLVEVFVENEGGFASDFVLAK